MGAGNAPTSPFIPLPGNREITRRQQIGKLGPSGEWGSVCAVEQPTAKLNGDRGASVSAKLHDDVGGKVRRFGIVPALPWKSFAAPESDREYTALLSYLPLNKWRAIPKFMRYTYRIRRQLATSEGLIGYSLDANVQSREFWTLSVWEDEESLRRFAQRTPHGRVMTDLLSDMGQTLFFPFRVDDSSIPEAVERVGRKQDRSVFGANLWDKPLLDPGYARATRNSCSSRSIHKEARSLWGSRPL